MNNLFIERTDSEPLIDFKANGDLKMEGKALPEDSAKLFNPIFLWVDELNAENVVLDINLIYFNTAVSKQLYELLCRLKENTNINKIKVIWQYEEGDDDSYEAGKLYEEDIPGIDFDFQVYAEM